MKTAEQAATHLFRKIGIDRIDIACILGSGWSGAADALAAGTEIGTLHTNEIPGWTGTAVPGHDGKIRVVALPRRANTTFVALISGRTHFYENRDALAATLAVRTMAAAGAHTVVLTNGCGSIQTNWLPGTVVAIKDHINLTGATPLLGPQFIDMTDAYSARLRDIVKTIEPMIPEGVYAQFPGPAYETPAEVQMAKVLGADLVGMSTALETLAAKAAGLEVLGLSLVTNLAAGVQETPLSHDEVLTAGKVAQPRLSHLLTEILPQL